MFHFGSKSARKSTPTAEAAVPEPVAVEPEKPKAGRVSTREVVELLEADLKRSGKRMEATGKETKGFVSESVAIVEDLRRGTDQLAEHTGVAL